MSDQANDELLIEVTVATVSPLPSLSPEGQADLHRLIERARAAAERVLVGGRGLIAVELADAIARVLDATDQLREVKLNSIAGVTARIALREASDNLRSIRATFEMEQSNGQH